MNRRSRIATVALAGLLAPSSAVAEDFDLQVLIENLQPTYYSFLPAPVLVLPAQAETLVAVTDVQLLGGGVLGAGATLTPGDVVASGVLWNLDSMPLSVASARGVQTLLSDEMLVISLRKPAEMRPPPRRGRFSADTRTQDVDVGLGNPKQCDVSCATGYYSCCCDTNRGALCRCVKNGEPEPCPGGCNAGGPGSTTCSIVLR
jgi:hypothetical protein